MNIGVIGLGLIGGSIAKAIKKYTEHTVLGFDKSADVVQKAQNSGVIDDFLAISSLKTCDIVILALYPDATVSFIKEHINDFEKGTVILDSCGTKRMVCESVKSIVKGYDLTFIGAHPMAGKECSGFDNSDGDLFNSASVILTPYSDTNSIDLEKVKSLYKNIGFSNVVISDPDTHDTIIAYTSQLAHIVSSSYVKSPTSQDFRGFSAGSFQDLTRVARLNDIMWTELFLENSDKLVSEIDEIILHLSEYRTALQENDADNLSRLLREGSTIKNEIDKKVIQNPQ